MCVRQEKHSGQFLVGDSAIELVAVAPDATVLLLEAMDELPEFSIINKICIVIAERSHAIHKTHGHVFLKIVCFKT